MNFANATHPGGGVKRGSIAQEECLCRSSNLYQVLDRNYLLENYYNYNKHFRNTIYTDRIIYSPDITVFKTDELYAVERPETEWFKVDVITAAAPRRYKISDLSDLQIRDIQRRRIKNILEVAIANDVDILILGAFGCGAFHNPPEVVAEVFRELLVDQEYGIYFEQVVFAIIDDHNREDCNYNVFKNVLEGRNRSGVC